MQQTTEHRNNIYTARRNSLRFWLYMTRRQLGQSPELRKPRQRAAELLNRMTGQCGNGVYKRDQVEYDCTIAEAEVVCRELAGIIGKPGRWSTQAAAPHNTAEDGVVAMIGESW